MGLYCLSDPLIPVLVVERLCDARAPPQSNLNQLDGLKAAVLNQTRQLRLLILAYHASTA